MPTDAPYSLFDGSLFSLPTISLSFFINPTALFVILLLFFIFYLILSIILMYHWSAYGMRSPGILVGETLFISVSLVLFMISSLAIFYF
ncbi:MAG: hypothetical protein A3H52_02305 [Candidatus Zambryskibacteria bacterium RIFCSPLOWO2_02_FULL_39_26]|uniref:Uncharacterized protein n=1 Tax=Candidatus Zambryskibacteria bacterium RIFCSPLOWO2_12_FULL_39_23 TaxID=1802776 RepID=A0A1G2UT52_9BACT|nr:MAG: hypothetical protein A2W51_00680 [Candidatus Zambryskibacteria bacterium RIFCSPHIGHO2_02_39_10]OHA99673.1 MAG: hypothetical protein A3E59_01155 [Candidatus Zambryskibacteria bacterium RIFCSPHIGHO2_12_FULL_39_47]OHB09469.1 MAG: hypothetical protein A3H52_02305 [Candidatus Zambryskibacteria bacterium RIFCSPLOWO2_02_FULL_39_26]OHB12569.1 MAG: hypothetical protein A3G99_01990 [Candidatus Zambryskibacteria bacterium RIFCSPLOWO2_12_FULL_39_23]